MDCFDPFTGNPIHIHPIHPFCHTPNTELGLRPNISLKIPLHRKKQVILSFSRALHYPFIANPRLEHIPPHQTPSRRRRDLTTTSATSQQKLLVSLFTTYLYTSWPITPHQLKLRDYPQFQAYNYFPARNRKDPRYRITKDDLAIILRKHERKRPTNEDERILLALVMRM